MTDEFNRGYAEAARQANTLARRTLFAHFPGYGTEEYYEDHASHDEHVRKCAHCRLANIHTVTANTTAGGFDVVQFLLACFVAEEEQSDDDVRGDY